MKTLRFIALATLTTLFSTTGVQAQKYYQSRSLEPGNPGGINNDSDVSFVNSVPKGGTLIYSYNYATDYKLQYSAVQTIPFAFQFAGGAVTKYKIASSGYITFSTSSNILTGPPAKALPTASLPDSSICTWGMAGAANGGKIFTKVYGASPHQQLWIVFWFGGNLTDTNSQNVWAIVLEQTTNNIYLVDEWGNVTTNAKNIYNPINLALGVQVTPSTAYEVAPSPDFHAHTWSPGNTDNIYYEFSPDSSLAYTPQIKYPLVEEFTQASCDPCYHAAPNVDSVLTNNTGHCTPVRYHVDWPGVDYMNNVIQNPFIDTMAVNYNVTGVPYGVIDGSSTFTPPGGYYNSLSSQMIQDEAYIGSPFNIAAKDSFDLKTNTYYVTAKITAYHAFAQNLVAKAIITVDTVSYTFDQSTEDPSSSFAPPIGSGADPDNTFQYVTKFPQVAEDMLPFSSGTKLPAFTVGQTVSLTFKWTKNHPWGDQPKSYKYDSTATHAVIYIQNTGSMYVYQSAYVSEGHTLTESVQNILDNSDFALYPNPANSSFNLAFNLNAGGNVQIALFNMLGQNVGILQNGMMAAGQHTLTFNTSTLKAGVYFVRYTSDNQSATKQLIIQK